MDEDGAADSHTSDPGPQGRHGPERFASVLGHWAFGLGLASTLVYYGTSEGIRTFVAFLADSVRKALKIFGHGA